MAVAREGKPHGLPCCVTGEGGLDGGLAPVREGSLPPKGMPSDRSLGTDP